MAGSAVTARPCDPVSSPGDLWVRVAGVVRHTDEVSSYVLEPVDGQPLPACEAGAHLDVYLPGGLVRSYSLCGDPARTTTSYEIAVKREDNGRGGSRVLHSTVREGETLRIGTPRNQFRLAPHAPHHLLLGGGIPHQQGGQGDDAFGQGRAEGRQQRTGGTLGEFEMMAGPFDAVDEVFAGKVDGDRRDEK